MSDFNINENAEVFNEKENKSKNIFVRILKWIGVGLIALICILLFYRCVSAKNHPIVKKVLMNDEFISAYEKDKDSVKVQKYGMDSAWVRVAEGRLVEFNELYYIPATNQLQFSIKYNHDIVKGEYDSVPFKLTLTDEDGNVFDEYWYETAERERFRYIRACFENIVLEKDEKDENGKKARHSYTLTMYMVGEDGEYDELCKYEIYDGDNARSDVFKNIPFRVE